MVKKGISEYESQRLYKSLHKGTSPLLFLSRRNKSVPAIIWPDVIAIAITSLRLFRRNVITKLDLYIVDEKSYIKREREDNTLDMHYA